jgi:hypothetical protein
MSSLSTSQKQKLSQQVSLKKENEEKAPYE